MQTHFHPTGKEETEQAELALYFADKAPKHNLVSVQLPPMFGVGAGIDIPAGESNYEVTDSLTLPVDVQAIEVGGHAHYICRQMLLTADFPDGRHQELLRIEDWDLDWQDQYQFADTIDLPKGTVLKAKIVFDNSADNPENPFSPPQRIAWGRESTDEMGSVSLQMIAKNESDRPKLDELNQKRTRQAVQNRVRNQSGVLGGLGGGQLGRGGMLKLLDRNKDGQLQSQEIPERFRERLLDFLDANGDETLDAQELKKGRESLDKLMDERKNGTGN
jgi:hypothetical protein